MQRRYLLTAGAAFTLMARLPPAQAQLPGGISVTDFGAIAQQIKSVAQEAQSYAVQLQQQVTQLQQYANMVQNTVALPLQTFAQVSGDIMQVRSLVNQASLLAGNSGSIMTRLQGAESLYNQASYLPANIGNQFTMWQNTMANAANSLGRTLGVQQSQLTNYAALQTAIQAHSQTATGQMQAIQAGVEMASLTSTQLNQMQATLTAAAQEAATRDMISAERTAAQTAAMLRFSQYQAAPTTGSQGF